MLYSGNTHFKLNTYPLKISQSLEFYHLFYNIYLLNVKQYKT